MAALDQGDVDIFVHETGPVIEIYRQGHVRLLGVTSATRVPAVPEIPTIAEACDMPGFDSTTWYSLLVPARAPAPIMRRLSDIFTRVARKREIEESVVAMGFTPAVADGEATRARLARDLVTRRAVVERVGARVE
jgi:tripartite-type tricarboxylate transporter receptor subunit TctC